ncbi:hypothetical protein SLEP1_g9283 [Rubroshorea leprosula]|uniref:Uncharacterized protein n=1 Tax=Rubroshorea leprosula TaxID=152421 RepID=A0AAV5IA43_9ROSI|nr:hypothetical protein SLEP1_g9283 [Rubroshorea leprosula]
MEMNWSHVRKVDLYSKSPQDPAGEDFLIKSLKSFDASAFFLLNLSLKFCLLI